ncbi:MAG: FAD-dependent oxidoreductase, partial [Thioalkalivibrio sp.]|nr:FAD-dependent oxidoreductase [Thioalkalivibrio sp.]
MQRALITSDLTVVGGGLAGVCAAVAAARLGRSVALVQNRPVLGGNSSSEIRVWVCSATSHGTQRYARETGIMGELFLENQFVNQEGNPYLWDLVLLEAVRREPNVQLFLNTDVHHLHSTDDGTIASVVGWQMGSERELTFTSPLFLDCTGDGLIGHLAGADHRVGREAMDTYGESLAPRVADASVLGSTILFYTQDAGRSVPFVPPSFAVDIAATGIPEKRVIRSGDNGCAYWWIEFGGDLDTIHDNENIRDNLWGVIYGIWDYIKNSGRFPDADTMTLEWVGAIPGKRESRRFLGDHVLTQHDILGQVRFDDTVAFGGWSIDLHPPRGVFESGSASVHTFSDGIYEIPYRSLYSRNVDNLLFAGRNLSASHVAFASTRVMATCATLGEAAGTAGALCVLNGVSPRDLYVHHRHELVQTLLRQDASVLGVRNDDPLDLARSARVSASSHLPTVALPHAARPWPLEDDAAVTVPVEERLDTLSLMVSAERDATLTMDFYDVSHPQNFVPNRLLSTVSVPVAAGERRWLEVPVGLEIAAPS